MGFEIERSYIYLRLKCWERRFGWGEENGEAGGEEEKWRGRREGVQQSNYEQTNTPFPVQLEGMGGGSLRDSPRRERSRWTCIDPHGRGSWQKNEREMRKMISIYFRCLGEWLILTFPITSILGV